MIAKSAQQNVMLPIMTDAADRKNTPIATGCLDYFPAALAEIALVSKMGNDQHNPGERLNWARGKSNDQADSAIRHFLARGTLDSDGLRHTAKWAWRALAALQTELEDAAGYDRAQDNETNLRESSQRELDDAALAAWGDYAKNPSKENELAWEAALRHAKLYETRRSD